MFVSAAVVDGEITKISLSDYKGKYVCLFFYPKVREGGREGRSEEEVGRGHACGRIMDRGHVSARKQAECELGRCHVKVSKAVSVLACHLQS